MTKERFQKKEKGEITTNNAEIQRNIGVYYEQLYGNEKTLESPLD